MPYTQATILEILRHASLLSPGERIASEDNKIDGVFYPKVPSRGDFSLKELIECN